MPEIYHDRDITSNTNVLTLSGSITSVNTLADRLKYAREALGWSQEYLAQKAGVSQGTIGNVESGLRKQPRDLVEIATAMGVNVEWLKNGKGPMPTLPTSGPAPVRHALDADQQAATLAQALPVVLDALAGLTPGRWGMVMSGLQPLAGHPEMRDDVIADVLPLLTAAPSKRIGT